MDKETAEKNLEAIQEQIGLLEGCINHATSHINALDPRSTLLNTYNAALEELRKEEWDYQEIAKMKD